MRPSPILRSGRFIRSFPRPLVHSHQSTTTDTTRREREHAAGQGRWRVAFSRPPKSSRLPRQRRFRSIGTTARHNTTDTMAFTRHGPVRPREDDGLTNIEQRRRNSFRPPFLSNRPCPHASAPSINMKHGNVPTNPKFGMPGPASRDERERETG